MMRLMNLSKIACNCICPSLDVLDFVGVVENELIDESDEDVLGEVCRWWYKCIQGSPVEQLPDNTTICRIKPHTLLKRESGKSRRVSCQWLLVVGQQQWYTGGYKEGIHCQPNTESTET
jgi:hypothetical protein